MKVLSRSNWIFYATIVALNINTICYLQKRLIEKRSRLAKLKIDVRQCVEFNKKTRFVNVASEKLRMARPLCFYELQVQHTGQLHLPRLGGSPS